MASGRWCWSNGLRMTPRPPQHMIKYCFNHHVLTPETSRSRKGTPALVCLLCARESSKKHRLKRKLLGFPATHPKDTVYKKTYRLKLRFAVIKAYGGKCMCCGETHYQFLQIDHMHGNGNTHRRKVFGSVKAGIGFRFYRWLRRQHWPKGYQLLCANCHAAKSYFGGCPHGKN